MPKFHNVEQRTDEWFDLRVGKITGSILNNVMAGETTKGFQGVIERLTFERAFKKRKDEPHFVSEDMQRGIDLEDTAVESFEKTTLIEVSPGGFWEYSDTIGDSPDGNVKNGTLEAKVVKESTMDKYEKSGKIDTRYKWQCQHHLLCSETELGYFWAWNSPERKMLVQYGVDQELREKMLKRFALVDSLVAAQIKG